MTVPSTTSRNDYLGTGTTGPFPYGFLIYNAAHLRVTRQDAAGNVTTLALGTDYSVSGVASPAGGAITTTVALASGEKLTIRRVVPLTQLTDYRNQQGFYAEVVEQNLDLAVQALQQHDDQLSRAILANETETGFSAGLPGPAARANQFLAFDAAGNPIATGAVAGTLPSAGLIQAVDTIATLRAVTAPAPGVLYQTRGYWAVGDGGSGLYRWNAGDSTADNGGTVIQLTAGGVGRWSLIVGPAPWSVRQFGAKGDGSTDDTSAFTTALGTGIPIFVPPSVGAYIVGDVPVPNGASLFGRSTPGYGAVTANATIVRRKTGCTAIFTCNGVGNFNDLTIDGVDKTCVGFGGAKGANLNNVYVQFCTNGLGSGGATYINTSVQSSVFYGCNYGIVNMRDSRVHNTTFAAQKQAGILLLAGANDNMICGCKLEWNEGVGINLTGSVHNAIVGCVIDRNFVAGLLFQSSSNCNTIAGCVLRRNGRSDNAPSSGDAHLVINSSNDITISGCQTQSGRDDDGGNNNTPKYIIQFNNTNTNIVAVGNDFTGFVASAFAFNSFKPVVWIQRSNAGVTAEEVGTLAQSSGGRNYLARFPSISVSAAASPTIGTVLDVGLNTFSRNVRTMTVYARDSTIGSTKLATFRLLTVRESGSASISCGVVFGEFGTGGSIGVGGGTVLNISFSNVVTDGSSFDIVAANNSSNTQLVTIEIT